MVKFQIHFIDIKVKGASLVRTPYKKTNDSINKLTPEFAEMHSEVQRSVNSH